MIPRFCPTENKATLEIAGRDQPEQKLYLLKDQQRLTWEIERAEAELWKAPPDPILEMVVRLMAERSEWIGSPTELAENLNVEMKPNALTRHLNVKASELKTEHGILYTNKPRHHGRRISLTKMEVEG